MRRVHSASTLAEATLVKSSLEATGVRVELRGLSRPGLAGEIPIPDAKVDVWVPDDQAEAAAAALAAIEAQAHLEWVCARCGEHNPASFETCWSCEAER